MAQFFAQYWYAIVGLVLGVLGIGMLWVLSRPGGTERHRITGFLMFGPFWPFVGSYFSRRGGLTRREVIGWAIVLIVMVLAVVLSPKPGA
jgi:uncharacterized membrane protein